MALLQCTDRKVYEEDVRNALLLLTGIWGLGKDGKYRVQYCSSDTTPTEKEARAALNAVLLCGDVPDELLIALAVLFNDEAPSNLVQRKIVFKKRSSGHSDVSAERVIASLVQQLRNVGCSYERAIEEAADMHKLGQRQVARIYSRHRKSRVVAALVARAERRRSVTPPGAKARGGRSSTS